MYFGGVVSPAKRTKHTVSLLGLPLRLIDLRLSTFYSKVSYLVTMEKSNVEYFEEVMRGYRDTGEEEDFCSTDSLNTEIWFGERFQGPEEAVQDLVSLVELGNQYLIEDIATVVARFLRNWIDNDPSVACVALNFASADSTGQIWSTAMEPLVQGKEAAWNQHQKWQHGGIACLLPPALDKLFQQVGSIKVNDWFLFERLVEWKERNSDKVENPELILGTYYKCIKRLIWLGKYYESSVEENCKEAVKPHCMQEVLLLHYYISSIGKDIHKSLSAVDIPRIILFWTNQSSNHGTTESL